MCIVRSCQKTWRCRLHTVYGLWSISYILYHFLRMYPILCAFGCSLLVKP